MRAVGRVGFGEPDTAAISSSFDALLARISAGAEDRDREPRFPEEPFRLLGGAGLLALPVPEPIEGGERSRGFTEEWRVLRAVAKADASVGRILDGHYNGVERVAVTAPEPLRSRELERVAAGELRLGVWGADPIPGEGEPAHLVETRNGLTVRGVKTWCSGSTGLDRALVLVRGARGGPGPPHLAYVDLSDGAVEVDRSWYKGSGMRASESHRVRFHDAPVLAVLGEPGEILREPYFGRDAVRTAATWAGMADSALDSALSSLSAKYAGRDPDDLVSVSAGRMLAARGTMDRWMEHAAAFADADPEAPLPFAIELRYTVAEACWGILDEAARALGSRPFGVGDALDRARRDLGIFLLQHRLEPALARAGRRAIAEHGQTP